MRLAFAIAVCSARLLLAQDLLVPIVSTNTLSARTVSVTASHALVKVSNLDTVAPTMLDGKQPVFLLLNRLNAAADERQRQVEAEMLLSTASLLQEKRMVTLALLDTDGLSLLVQPRTPARVALLGIELYNKTAKLLPSDWSSREAPPHEDEDVQVKAVARELTALDRNGAARDHVLAAHIYIAELASIAQCLGRIPGRKSVLLVERVSPFTSEAVVEGSGLLNSDKAVAREYQEAIAELNAAHVSIYRVGYGHVADPSGALLASATGGEAYGSETQLDAHLAEMQRDFGPYTVIHCTTESKGPIWHPLIVKVQGQRIERAPTGFFSVAP